MEANQNIFKNFIPRVLQEISPEQGIFHVLAYLNEHIPFDSAFFLTIDTEKKFFTRYIEYTHGKNRGHAQTIPFPAGRAYHLLLEMYSKSTENTVYFPDAWEDNPTREAFRQMDLGDQRSVLNVLLSATDDLKIRHSLLISAKKVEVFHKAHIDILVQFREILWELSSALFMITPTPNLIITPSAPLPMTSEAQLRSCPGLRKVMEQVDTVAQSLCTVLLLGPTGVGKELVAETIHARSARFIKPFVRVNSGAIPETLIDSEFFGHEKAAFTGATQAHKGYFEQANHGTIYLDEIGELSLNAQARLLRVLESREIRRVGSERPTLLDARIIAATHRDLWKMVEEGTFREDLAYRLHVFPISIPALDKRPKDIMVLAEYFYRLYISQIKPEHPPTLTQLALQRLMKKKWPGSVRQLRHYIERAVLISIKAKAEFLILDDDPSTPLESVYSVKEEKTARLSLTKNPMPHTTGMEEISNALAQSGGRIQGESGAAALLGLHPATLRYRMKKYGIPLPRG